MTAPHLTPQQIGDRLEEQLELLHNRYRADRLALIEHSGTRAIHTRDGWQPVDSAPDYNGCLWGGRWARFDAKHCLEDTYRHDTRTRGHQLIDIWDAYQAGAVAGILVVNTVIGAGRWLVPSAEWAVGQFRPRALELALPVPAHEDFKGIYMPDWLEVAK